MRNISLLAIVAILFSSCGQDFKKGEKGLEYKITATGSGEKLKIGNFLQMHVCQIISDGKKDTVVNDTRKNGTPIIEPFDSKSIPPEYFKIISQLRKGDSLTIRLLVDSMYKDNPGAMPPFMKKGNYFLTTVKLLNVFTNQSQMETARKKDMQLKMEKDSIENIQILAKEDKELQAFFKKNNITGLQKTKLGTYVQIIQPGTGAMIDTSVVVETKYTGRLLNGKMFDSNTDSSSTHREPFNVNMTNDYSLGAPVIKGWTDGLKLLNKGAKAKFYVPSVLAYGKEKVGEIIPENAILMFEIEVLNILTKAQAYSLIENDLKIQEDSSENTPIIEKAPNGWHQLDRTETGFNGISLDKAYEFLREKKLKSKKVIVAVIDSGIDTLHEDLKPVMWTNPREIPGNGIDDDKNGYVDDVHGWNFLGGKDGKNVKEDSYEGARVYHKLKQKWDGKTITESNLSASDLKSYRTYLRAKAKVVGEIDESQIDYLKTLYPMFLAGDSILRKEIGKEEYNGNDLNDNNTSNADAKMTKNLILSISKSNDSYDITNQQLIDEIGGQLRKADAAVEAPPTYRKDIVKDNENDFKDKSYGNNDIMASTPFHGTHCAGIIGAARNNNTGIDGIADNVSIMMLRAVPDGDEHDKDIALAIRYAVDNGAKIISMSFGKDFSPEKQWVDEAFKYAEKKGVLLIHAAGNDAKNIDTAYNFPNPIFENGSGRATNVITVGASGDEKTGGLTASFSNFGKNEVDVFAPGVNIYSTIPGGNTYGNASGTSMACPVVAGIAALLLEYYPNLTSVELKMIIEISAVVCTQEVNKPGTDEKVILSELSKTGAFANAFEAVKMADAISRLYAKPQKN